MGRECRLEGRLSGLQVSPRRASAAAAEEGVGQPNAVQPGIKARLHAIADDVVFYVGQSRKPYSVGAESLIRSSAYFGNMLSKRRPPMPPVVMDCEESVFEGLLLLMRYGAWEALPPLSAAQAFRLRKEAELYGVHYIEPPPRTPDSAAASPDASPKPANGRTASTLKRLAGRLSDGARPSGTTARPLSELSGFSPDLADPAKLILATCLDDEKAAIYACEHCPPAGAGRRPTAQWALSFHHKHAFCTACGRPPIKMPPKHFAEMFTGAAAQYSGQSAAHEVLLQGGKPAANWGICSDSTCLLRLVSSLASGPDACRSASCSSFARSPGAAHPDTVWAVTFFYSHAFCSRCGESADGSALVSLLLALRYGGSTLKGRSSFKSIPDS